MCAYTLRVCVCLYSCFTVLLPFLFSGPGTSTPPAIAATPVSAIPAALGVNGYSPVPTQPTGQPAPDALYPNGVHPYPGIGFSTFCILFTPSIAISLGLLLFFFNFYLLMY